MYTLKCLRNLLTGLLFMTLAACALTPGSREGGAPVVDQTTPGAASSSAVTPAPDETASPGVTVTPAVPGSTGRTQPLPPTGTRPSVVVGLLDTAERQVQARDPAAAAATLERALRIAPKDPLLWQRLAAVRLEQGRWELAEQMAAKSTMLAGDDRRLITTNWLLIAEARQGRGDAAGARRAREQASQASE